VGRESNAMILLLGTKQAGSELLQPSYHRYFYIDKTQYAGMYMKSTSFIWYCTHVLLILFAMGLCLGVYADDANAEHLHDNEQLIVHNVQVDSDEASSRQLSTVIQINQNGRDIVVSYRGGSSQPILRSLEAQVTTPDGITTTKDLGRTIGSRVVFPGNSCGGEVIVTADYYSGQREVVASKTLPGIWSMCQAPQQVFSNPCEGVMSTLQSSTGSVDFIPRGKAVVIQIGNDIRSVVVSFRGGFGQNLVRSIQVFGYSADGSVQTHELNNTVGDSVRLTTDGCGIRVVVQVDYFDGTSYIVADQAISTFVR